MGAKIEFSYLSNESNKVALDLIVSVLVELGWTYNVNIPGEYNYWIDGPIWKFGSSKTEREPHLSQNNDFEKLKDIIEKISKFYSPSIQLGTRWFQKDVYSLVSIDESENEWKDITFSLDRYEVYDSLSNNDKEKAVLMLKEIFSRIGKSIRPYYGIGATEIEGVVSSPENLIVEDLLLGDFNYFSPEVSQKLKFNKYEKDYTIEVDKDGACLIYRRKCLEF